MLSRSFLGILYLIRIFLQKQPVVTPDTPDTLVTEPSTQPVPVPDPAPVPVPERVDLSKTSKCGEVKVCARKMLKVFNDRIVEPVFLYGFQILSNQLQIVFPHHFPITRRSNVVKYPIDVLINPLNLLKLLRNQISIHLVKKLLNGNGLCSKFQKMIARAILSRFVQFDASSSSCIGFLAGQTQPTNKVTFSPDGSIVAITCRFIVKICKIDPNGSLVCLHILNHSSNVMDVVFHQSLPYFVTCSDSASIYRILDNGTFELVTKLKAGRYESDRHNALIPEGDFSSACFHPTKPLLVSGSTNWCMYLHENTGTVWNRIQRIDRTPKSSTERCYGHFGRVNTLKFDPSGKILVSGSSDDTIKIWRKSPQTSSWICVRTIEENTDDVNDVAFNSTGSLLATVSDDKTTRFYDTNTWSCVYIIQTGHTKGITCCLFHPTNDRIFVTSSYDYTTKICLLLDGLSSSKILETLSHHSTVSSLAFDPITSSRLLIGLSMNYEDMNKLTVELYKLPK